ncbi:MULTISPECIES: trans-aconitate 2-methyltransferase [Streptomyces]|uniref:Type 11 methyltransferase n=1 Tax=Streptomyces zinciresistens K42 TaxID=700597 RepID=G2G5S9_9ACTN|nr:MULTISPECIES: class I SAM-dependent methyltransferase [Streptomyces]EGX61018.1 type 11 methyltransferase [Streptomyces zinciresistens K42]MDT9696545.1 class I SAM-dependent methyltransferase [Streptomyces sp. P17]
MNRIEKAAINNPARRALQRLYEVPTLLKLAGGPLPPGAKAAELGCGPGYGTKLILDRFRAAHVDAVDLDPYMITKARRRLAREMHRVRLAVGDATDLRTAFGAADSSYEAVFDFAIIHHIPDWRSALTETARALKPGGLFVFEEVTAHALARPSYRLLFDHPTEDRFTAEQFLAELPRHGLAVRGSLTRIRGDYLLGAAVRSR